MKKPIPVHLDGKNKLFRRHSLFDRLDDSEDDSGSVLQRSSVVVGSLVDSGGQELNGREKDK